MNSMALVMARRPEGFSWSKSSAAQSRSTYARLGLLARTYLESGMEVVLELRLELLRVAVVVQQSVRVGAFHHLHEDWSELPFQCKKSLKTWKDESGTLAKAAAVICTRPSSEA